MTQRDKYYQLLDAYVRGNLSIDERHELEKKALDDPFFFDAMEGWLVMGHVDHQKHIERLLKKIRRKKQESLAGRIIWPIAIAASLLLLFTVGNILLKDDEQSLVTVTAEDDEAIERANPTIDEELNQEIVYSEEAENTLNEDKPATSQPAIKEPPPPEKPSIPLNEVAENSSEIPGPTKATEPKELFEVKNSVNEDIASAIPARKTPSNRIPIGDIRGLADQTAAQQSMSQAQVGPLLIIDEDLDRFIQQNLFMRGIKLSSEQEFSFAITFNENYVVTKIESLIEENNLTPQIIEFINKYDNWKKESLPPNLYGKYNYPSKK